MKKLILIFLFLSGSLWAIKPYPNYIKTPKDYSLNYDSLNIITPDNARLTAWHIKSGTTEPVPTVIMACSDAGNMSYFLDLAGYLNQNFKYSIVLFDYRGFGTSSPFKIDSNMLTYREYLTDINSVINWVKNNLKAETNYISLYGTSMGAALSICAASSRNDIKIVIADSPYSSQELFVKNLNLNNKSENVTFKPDKTLNPADQLPAMPAKTSLLLIYCQNDQNIGSDEMYGLYKSCPSEYKSLWISPHCSHLQSLYLYPDNYLDLFKMIVRLK